MVMRSQSRWRMLSVTGNVIHYSVFAKIQKENDMSAKIAVTRTDYTTENLRAPASRHKYRDCRVRLRAIALMIEDDLPRSEISRSVGVDVQTVDGEIEPRQSGGKARFYLAVGTPGRVTRSFACESLEPGPSTWTTVRMTTQ